MTKEQCLKKINSIMPDIKEYIRKESERLLNSGGVDIETYSQDFVLAKIVLVVVLKNLTDQYMPLHKYLHKEIKNLSCF